MTKNEVKMLLDYGFSVTEIADMEKTPAPEPAPEPAPAPAPDDVSNRDLLTAVTRLTNMMAVSNIRNTTITTPEPDVTAQLNSLFAAPAAQK